jgi:hypothetical protein
MNLYFRQSKYLGYQQITDLSSATALTVPTYTLYALVTPESQAVRWRAGGVDPTATVGYPLPAGSELEIEASDLSSVKFIEQAAGAKLNIIYFGAGPIA